MALKTHKKLHWRLQFSEEESAFNKDISFLIITATSQHVYLCLHVGFSCMYIDSSPVCFLALLWYKLLIVCVSLRTPAGVWSCAMPQWLQPVWVAGWILVHLYYQRCGRPASLRGGSPEPQDQVSESASLGISLGWHTGRNKSTLQTASQQKRFKWSLLCCLSNQKLPVNECKGDLKFIYSTFELGEPGWLREMTFWWSPGQSSRWQDINLKKMEQWIKGGPLLPQDQHWSKSWPGFKYCVMNGPKLHWSLTMQNYAKLQWSKTSHPP